MISRHYVMWLKNSQHIYEKVKTALKNDYVIHIDTFENFRQFRRKTLLVCLQKESNIIGHIFRTSRSIRSSLEDFGLLRRLLAQMSSFGVLVS